MHIIMKEHTSIYASDLYFKNVLFRPLFFFTYVSIYVICLWLASEFLKVGYYIINISSHLTKLS